MIVIISFVRSQVYILGREPSIKLVPNTFRHPSYRGNIEVSGKYPRYYPDNTGQSALSTIQPTIHTYCMADFWRTDIVMWSIGYHLLLDVFLLPIRVGHMMRSYRIADIYSNILYRCHGIFNLYDSRPVDGISLFYADHSLYTLRPIIFAAMNITPTSEVKPHRFSCRVSSSFAPNPSPQQFSILALNTSKYVIDFSLHSNFFILSMEYPRILELRERIH